MATPCINPETALFPEFDFWWLDLFVSRGIDMPCEFYGFALNVAIFAVFALLSGLVLLVWFVATYRARHACNSRSATQKEIRRLRRKNELRAARNLYSTKGKYFTWQY